jgi:hypothetical protein
MTQATKNKIGRGIRKANLRKRMSLAMKASWQRRRSLSNGTLAAGIDSNIHRTTKNSTRRLSLREIADALGIDTDQLIKDEIRKVLDSE